ncbi:MAG TPA: TetR/AcrR family transcriptional regulator C-terminal domain-containing protein [Dehalococcoidia bacterium]|nr:TetR/AcrR family transcriptional regulator C-terminal domain-containing protein [Dehalococcoidia bacterium]
MNREPLSRQRIIDAAIRLVDAEGLEAFTMRRLADELDVEGASLYKHIPNKAAVLVGMLRTIFTEVEPVYPPHPSWRDRLLAGMRGFREDCLRHPRIFTLAMRPWESINSQRMEEDLAAMRATGFSEEQAAYAFRVLASYVTGFVARESAYMTRDPQEVREEEEEAQQTAAHFPHSRASTRILSARRLDAAFVFGLNAMLDGIELQVLRE